MADPVPPTDQELLDGARVALAAAYRTGKSVTFNGRTYTSHDLGDLSDLITTLETRVAGVIGGSRTRVAAYCKGV